MNQEEKMQQFWNGSNPAAIYDEGVKLYSLFGKNNFLRRDFPDKGKNTAPIIIYDLCKSDGLNYRQLKSDNLNHLLQLQQDLFSIL